MYQSIHIRSAAVFAQSTIKSAAAKWFHNITIKHAADKFHSITILANASIAQNTTANAAASMSLYIITSVHAFQIHVDNLMINLAHNHVLNQLHNNVDQGAVAINLIDC
jgi:hypothetical protein